jgi:organic radical activating enzyme
MERISVEVSNRCGKGCSFCYSSSNPAGESEWNAEDLSAFAIDCAANGVRAISFGGGEPLEWPALDEVLARTRGKMFRSLTTNGLHLSSKRLAQLPMPEKIHVSIHFPERDLEIRRAIDCTRAISARGIKSGVNLLVRRSALDAARSATERLYAAGIGPERIMFLPMRGDDTPSPEDVAKVAGARFQSMSCLMKCGKSPRFCSVGWDRSVGWCSYTQARNRLREPTFAALKNALDGLRLEFCGDDGSLVPLRRTG